jgi:HEPN domain-containing protein
MPSHDKDIRLFQRAAAQRLTASRLLLEHGFYLESIYIAGYAVECALKGLILLRTPKNQKAGMVKKITKVGSKGHDFEYLKNLLRQSPSNLTFPSDVHGLLRKVATWSTSMRYEVGRGDHDDAKEFIAAVQKIRDWAERS